MKTGNKELHKDRVLLGFSGGVDSTAAALLLRKAGYSVTGLFFDVHKEKSPNAKLAEKTASELEIPFIYRNVYEDFSREIIDYFCREYQVGRTPNPCVMCNPTIKFPVLLEEADAIGAYHIATGHYAGIHYDDESGLYYIKQAENLKKPILYALPAGAGGALPTDLPLESGGG
jgi:tRNA-specific 2-thiouridylase